MIFELPQTGVLHSPHNKLQFSFMIAAQRRRTARNTAQLTPTHQDRRQQLSQVSLALIFFMDIQDFLI